MPLPPLFHIHMLIIQQGPESYILVIDDFEQSKWRIFDLEKHGRNIGERGKICNKSSTGLFASKNNSRKPYASVVEADTSTTEAAEQTVKYEEK